MSGTVERRKHASAICIEIVRGGANLKGANQGGGGDDFIERVCRPRTWRKAGLIPKSECEIDAIIGGELGDRAQFLKGPTIKTRRLGVDQRESIKAIARECFEVGPPVGQIVASEAADGADGGRGDGVGQLEVSGGADLIGCVEESVHQTAEIAAGDVRAAVGVRFDAISFRGVGTDVVLYLPLEIARG